ncbi:AI-2E family transporter [Caulobacter segnis]
MLVLIYFGFIIASRRGFARKIVALFPHHAEREQNMKRSSASATGWSNICGSRRSPASMIAIAAWVVMMLVRLDNALFWAFLIFLAAYIPIPGRGDRLLPAAAVRPGAVPRQPVAGGRSSLFKGGPAGDLLRGRQRRPAAHAGRQPEPWTRRWESCCPWAVWRCALRGVPGMFPVSTPPYGTANARPRR